MLTFTLYKQGKAPEQWPLRNAYLLGAEGNPMRGKVVFEKGVIVCQKREPGTAALVLQHQVGDLGELTLQTTQLPDRPKPYLLNLELARHRLMLLLTKLEDWQMFDLDEEHLVIRRAAQAQKIFIDALCCQDQDPARAEQLAAECLVIALDGSEELALTNSELWINRRKMNGSLPRYPLGCGVALEPGHQRLRGHLLNKFDFLLLPTPWKHLTPEERDFDFDQLDGWVDAAVRGRTPILAGPLVNFDATNLPNWAYIWEHDYEELRDLIFEYVDKIVTRYGPKIAAWNVVSGLHANKHFNLNLDQVMDLTRMAVMQVKKVRPNALALIEIVQPHGEYYASDPCSIAPMTYADLIADSSLGFDAFAIRYTIGQAVDGHYTRDLMQLSHMLDEYVRYKKPVYVFLSVPSAPVTSTMIARPNSDAPVDDNSGFWRRPWSPAVQSHWAVAAMQIALSKPFVDAVAWQEVVDHGEMVLPLGGLINERLEPKVAYDKLMRFHEQLVTLGAGKIDANSLLGAGGGQKGSRTAGIIQTQVGAMDAMVTHGSESDDPAMPG